MNKKTTLEKMKVAKTTSEIRDLLAQNMADLMAGEITPKECKEASTEAGKKTAEINRELKAAKKPQ